MPSWSRASPRASSRLRNRENGRTPRACRGRRRRCPRTGCPPPRNKARSCSASTADEPDGDPAPAADLRGERRRHQEDRAADDLVDAERREIPFAELAPELGGAASESCRSSVKSGGLYHGQWIVAFRIPAPASGRRSRCRRDTTPTGDLRSRARRFDRAVWVGVGRLRTCPRAPTMCARDRWRQRHHGADRRRPRARVLQRVPPSGTQLCAEDAGRFAGAIQCPYHAWTYDYDGRFLGAPHMDGSPGFEREDSRWVGARRRLGRLRVRPSPNRVRRSRFISDAFRRCLRRGRCGSRSRHAFYDVPRTGSSSSRTTTSACIVRRCTRR